MKKELTIKTGKIFGIKLKFQDFQISKMLDDKMNIIWNGTVEADTVMLNATLENYIDGRLPVLKVKDVKNMLMQIGNPDSYIRDELIYQSFGKLIFSNQLNSNELEKLLVQLNQDEYLFYGIGEQGTDSVFTRSFSVLVIAAIIEYDVVKLQLNKRIIEHTVKRVVEYMLAEMDTRGFVEGKGWAHAIAHGADALDALAKHPLLIKENVVQILYAVQYSLFNQVDYLDEEEERLAVVVVSLLKHQDAEEVIRLWLAELIRQVEVCLMQNKGSIGAYHKQRNVKNFLKSFYVNLNAKGIGESVNPDVFEVLKKWMYLQ